MINYITTNVIIISISCDGWWFWIVKVGSIHSWSVILPWRVLCCSLRVFLSSVLAVSSSSTRCSAPVSFVPCLRTTPAIFCHFFFSRSFFISRPKTYKQTHQVTCYIDTDTPPPQPPTSPPPPPSSRSTQQSIETVTNHVYITTVDPSTWISNSPVLLVYVAEHY